MMAASKKENLVVLVTRCFPTAVMCMPRFGRIRFSPSRTELAVTRVRASPKQ